MHGLIATEPLRAGIEDLLPVALFVVIWWVSSRRERKRRLERQSSPPQRTAARPGQPLASGNGEGVDPLALIRQMFFGDLELPPLGGEPAPSAPPPLPGGQDRVGREGEGGEGAAPPPATRMKVVTAPRPEWVREPSRQPATTGPTGQPRVVRGSPLLARASRRELQRAVIWSEILAPPVALRDE